MNKITRKYNSITVTRFFTAAKTFNLDKVIRLDGEKSLSSVFSSYGWKLLLLSLKTINKASARIRLYHKLAMYLTTMTKRHGAEYTVQYLKASSLAISKAIAGEPFSSLRETCPELPLPRLTSTGLPVIIQTRDRQSILSNNVKVIRMYTTFFSLYRVILIPGKLKLSTITDAYTGDPEFLKEFGGWLSYNTPSIIGKFKVPGWGYVGAERFLFKESSSASKPISWTSMIIDAHLIDEDPLIGPAFRKYLELSSSDGLKRLFEGIVSKVPISRFQSDTDFLGRLSTKVEPAGKIRVFAIVDGWTQSILEPLHQRIFSLLRKLPNDGTFDQSLAFDRACQKAIKYNCCYGYDLSAATDRLPISLQIEILGSLIGKDLADAWAKLLVGREYWLKVGPSDYQPLKYSVGQPMGALSSWAMLALTHHMIMQYCSWKLTLSKSWETRYEVLGDDIVIFDAKLASEYLRIMELIGVPINVKKSVVAKDRPVVEFAKRLAIAGQEVSALSWKQFISLDSFKGRISLAISLFLKDKSFTVKPMAVFNTVMKSRAWDKRIHMDVFAIYGALNSYLMDRGNLRVLLRYVLTSRPHVLYSQMQFDKLNISWLTEMLVKHVKGLVPDKPTKQEQFKFDLALPPIKQLLVDKCEKLTSDMTIAWVKRQGNAVARTIISTYSREMTCFSETQMNSLIRLIGGHFVSTCPFVEEGAHFAKADKRLSLEAIYEIYTHLTNLKSYYLLNERFKAGKVVKQEVKINTTEVLKWVAEQQRSSHNDFMYFDI